MVGVGSGGMGEVEVVDREVVVVQAEASMREAVVALSSVMVEVVLRSSEVLVVASALESAAVEAPSGLDPS